MDLKEERGQLFRNGFKGGKDTAMTLKKERGARIYPWL